MSDSSLLLSRRAKPADSKDPGTDMLGSSPGHAFAPQLERTGFQVTTHDPNHL